MVENSVFARNLDEATGCSCTEGVVEGAVWAQNPWEAVSATMLEQTSPDSLRKRYFWEERERSNPTMQNMRRT